MSDGINNGNLINSTLVLDLKNHNIFSCFSGNSNFYVSIPKGSKKSNIAVELSANSKKFSIEENDSVWVNSNLKDFFVSLDDTNLCYVMPVINNDLTTALQNNDVTRYRDIESYVCNIINVAADIIKRNQKEFDSKVIMVQSTNLGYQAFIKKFTEKYNSRTMQVMSNDLVTNYPIEDLNSHISFIVGKASTSEENNVNNYTNVYAESSGAQVVQLPINMISNVVGPTNNNGHVDVASTNSFNSTVPVSTEMNMNNDTVNENLENSKGRTRKLTPSTSTGFVSYYLLGIITIAVTLLILYILL